MKLVAFNIQNYRSIIHTGWCNLAHDNITALIGQNESGKTSVLGALDSFHHGIINEDVLRSDLSLPVVSCRFELGKNKLSDFLDFRHLPEDLQESVAKATSFELSRSWRTDRSSKIYISSDEIRNYFEKVEIEKASIAERTKTEINKLLQSADKVFSDMELVDQQKAEAQQKLTATRKLLDQHRKKFNKARKPDEKLIAEKELEAVTRDYEATEENYKKQTDAYEKTKKLTQELSEKVSTCKSYNEAQEKVQQIGEHLASNKSRLKELEHQYEIASNEKDQRNAYNQIQQLKSEQEGVTANYQRAVKEEALLRTVAGKILSGVDYKTAQVQARQELERDEELYTLGDIGEILIKQIPVFEFFEDFSSLLPNKIDLEDILIENTNVEGYKAARNFLVVAGLNAEFFREKNQRILKQKIENLNGEITINFQDYWSQNVGRNSKIELNFELEHYDYTHPEKSGKPYLEFWIKDKNERLYPKQRSRGVRWFLSFYLELKATAKESKADRVLLIDEPGLSLHARAQEDVLKVFEDLRDSMQILYCTHSPHLIDTNKLYRILAVQRADEQDDRSETLILDPGSLYSASTDTLSPVYTLMGIKINNQDFIQAKNNIIVEDTLAYYYLNAFFQLAESKIIPAFIPSTGLTNIPVLANILMGWKVDFSIAIFGESRGDQTIKEVNKSFFFAREDEMKRKLIKIENFEYPEDIFSTLDFKKFVLQKREGITQKNSDYIIEQGLSRTILASQFINYCENKAVKLTDFDTATQTNINQLINRIINT